MAKRTVSFSDYEEPTWEEYTGEDPPVGKWFTGTVKRGRYLEDDDQMLFVVEISDEDSPYRGWGRGWYAPFEGDLKWKMHEIVRALQGGKTTDVSLDWTNDKVVEAWLKKSKPIKFMTGEYNDKINIRKVRPLMEAVSTAPKKTEPVVEPEPDLDDTEEDYTEEELGGKTVEELQEILKEEFEVEVPKKGRRQSEDDYFNALVDAVLDAQEEALSEEEGDDAAEVAEEAEGENESEFDDGFEDDDEEDDAEEEETEPEPAPRSRRTRAAAAPAKKAAPAAKATGSTRRRRG